MSTGSGPRWIPGRNVKLYIQLPNQHPDTLLLHLRDTKEIKLRRCGGEKEKECKHRRLSQKMTLHCSRR